MGQTCVQNLPDYDSHSYTMSLPDRVQALVPAYKIQCRGILTELTAQVSGDDTQIIFQVWRPTPTAGSYTILADLRYLDLGSTREGDIITVMPLVMIPVRPGDVIGFYIDNSEDGDQIQLQYENGSNVAAETTVYYFEGSDVPLCNFSLCDASHVSSIGNIAPLISVQIGKLGSDVSMPTLLQKNTMPILIPTPISFLHLYIKKHRLHNRINIPAPTWKDLGMY